MEKPQLFIGCDHGGYALKVALVRYLTEKGYTVTDVGCDSEAIVRYPLYAASVAKAVLAADNAKGILLCSTGIGMSIIANKFKGIRAALCYSSYQARMTSAHNNSNILCLGGRCVGVFEAQDMLDNWLETRYEGGRHDISLGLIEEAEQVNFSDMQWLPQERE
ncbi:ribose 5-phosphate isomerase B [Spirosoma areae]